MKATVKKWGNNAAVRIPASVMQATNLAGRDGGCARGGGPDHH